MVDVYWTGAINDCDLCGQPIKDTFIDGRIRGRSSWGIMCPDCHQQHGIGLGQGCGQRYRKQPDGRWLKTGG